MRNNRGPCTLRCPKARGGPPATYAALLTRKVTRSLAVVAILTKHIHAEGIDLAVNEVGNARLSDAEDFGGLDLGQALALDVAGESQDEGETELEVLRLGWIGFDGVPNASLTLVFVISRSPA